jgi:hypothetical protein
LIPNDLIGCLERINSILKEITRCREPKRHAERQYEHAGNRVGLNYRPTLAREQSLKIFHGLEHSSDSIAIATLVGTPLALMRDLTLPGVAVLDASTYRLLEPLIPHPDTQAPKT